MHDPEFQRLKWRCRRGLLELDLMLQSFLETVYPSLTAAQRNAFGRLLETQDHRLLDYLQGNRESPDEELREIVKKIRQ